MQNVMYICSVYPYPILMKNTIMHIYIYNIYILSLYLHILSCITCLSNDFISNLIRLSKLKTNHILMKIRFIVNIIQYEKASAEKKLALNVVSLKSNWIRKCWPSRKMGAEIGAPLSDLITFQAANIWGKLFILDYFRSLS